MAVAEKKRGRKERRGEKTVSKSVATPVPAVPIAVPESAPKVNILSSPRERTLAISLSLLLATLCAYSSTLHNVFINPGDEKYFRATPEVRQGFDWDVIRWAFTTFAHGNWHPLTWLSHVLDYQLFHGNPVSIHVESLLIHVASAIVLFLLLQQASGSARRSAAVAAFFALHPVNVEAVAWATERKSVLSMLFFMLAAWAYVRYAKQPTVERYLGVPVAFAAGLMASPQIVTLPFVLLLVDVWPLQRWGKSNESQGRAASWQRLLLEKVPLFLLSAASCVLALRARTAEGGISWIEYPLGLRSGNAVVAYARYLGKAVWPFDLALFYPFPANLPAWEIAAALLLLVGISALVWMARSRTYLVVGWLWFLITLLPMIGLVQVTGAAIADRYAYLPFIGLFLAMTWGVADWAEERKIPDNWVGIAAGVVLVMFSVATYRQGGYWRDGESVWTHTVQATRDNFVAHTNLGIELERKGRTDEAVAQYRDAYQIYPQDPVVRLRIGLYEGSHGNPQAAVEHLNAALQFTKDPSLQETAYATLGTAYRNLRDFGHAKENFQTALQINGANLTAITGMGLIAQHEKNLPEAIRWYSQAVLAQRNAVACLLLAQAMEKNGQIEDSKGVYEEAKNLSGDITVPLQVVDQMLATVE